MLATKLGPVGEALLGSWPDPVGRAGRQLQGRGDLGASSVRWGGGPYHRQGRAVGRLQKVHACISASNPTLGFSKMSAVMRGGPEDAGDEAEDCGGSSAQKLGRLGGQEGASSAGEEEIWGPFRARGRRSSSLSGGAVNGPLGVERLCHRLCLGVLLAVGGKPGVLEVPLVIHEGLEDAGGGVEGLGDVGLLHGPRASSTGCCLSSPASGVRGSAIWGWRSWTWQGPLCCMHGSTDGLSRGEVGVNGVEFHSWPPGKELAGPPAPRPRPPPGARQGVQVAGYLLQHPVCM